MPVCSQCQSWIELGGTCVRCGASRAEMTAVDVRVAPLASVQPLRPIRRPSVPMLIALDDDSDLEGEVRRLRDVETTIGRRGADWTFSGDLDMSAAHAKIVRNVDRDGLATWRLVDQGSSNGSFLKLSSIELSDCDTLKIGGLLVCWENEATTGPQLKIFAGSDDASIVRLRNQKVVTIGRNPAAAQIVLHHCTVDPLHAVLKLVGKTWRLEDQSSRNGIWQRLDEAPLTSEARFILGEQRFLFRLPQPASTDAGQQS